MKKFFAAAAEKVRAAGAWLRGVAPMIFNDAMALAGACFIVKGVSLIYVPAAWILGGVIMIAAVFVRELTARGGAK